MDKLLRSGQRLGAYEIVRHLGTGGMGQVYEAKHVELGVHRALKVFSTDSEHGDFLRKRFGGESRMLADLQHPRVVRVYDFAVDKTTAAPYFAMDLVVSPNDVPQTLADAYADGIEEEQVAQWFRDICEGLDYIHSHGVVHRDISLENILIGRDGHAVITDFGIARITDDDYRRKINVTMTMVAKDAKGLCMGKGAYMAPELRDGFPATPASDAYALGVLVFWLLTGCWYDPDGNTNMTEMFAAMEYDWAPVLGKLLNSDPATRLPDDGIGAMPRMLKPAVQHWWRNRNAISMALALLLALAAGAAALIVWRSQPPSRVSEPPPQMRTNTATRVSKSVNQDILSDLENAILSGKGNSNGSSGK